MKLTLLAGFVLVVVSIACSGDDAPAVDAGATCTGAEYDSCTDTAGSSDCLNGVACREYGSQGFTICSPSCSATVQCPDQNGTAISCNGMGFCRGDAPNACTLP